MSEKARRWLPLIPILVVAVLMRVGYMSGLGYSPDMFNSTGWIASIEKNGLLNFYTNVTLRSYPSISIIVHGDVGVLQQWFGLTLDPIQNSTYLALLKLVPVVAELALIVAVYGWLRRERSLRWLIPGLLAVHPGLVVTTAWWGQNESQYILPVALALIALNRDRPLSAWAFFGIALMMKQQSLFLTPLILILTFRRYGWRTTAIGIAITGLICLILTLPFALASGWDRALSPYLAAADRYPEVTNNAFNFWQITVPLGKGTVWPDGTPYGDSVSIAGPFTLKYAGLLMLGLYTLLICVQLWRHSGERREFVWAAALYFATFLLPTQVHERYLYAATVLALIAIAQDRRLWLIALVTIYTYTNNVLQVAARFTLLGWTAWYVSVGSQVAILNVVLFIELTRIVLTSHPDFPSLLAERGPGGEVNQWPSWVRTQGRVFLTAMRIIAVVAVIALVVGLIAEGLTNRATAKWLVTNVPDSSRLVADGQAEEIVALTKTQPNAQTWDWRTPWNADDKPVAQWVGEGVHYLLVDERTYQYEDLSKRLQRLIDQGATVEYRSNNVLGVGPRQAVLYIGAK